MTCERCDGAGWQSYPGGMARCVFCSPTSWVMQCQSRSGCLEPFRCNLARKCSMPKPSHRRVLESMQVGESVVFPGDEATKVRKAAHDVARRSAGECLFTSRTVPEGLKVWRVT